MKITLDTNILLCHLDGSSSSIETNRRASHLLNLIFQHQLDFCITTRTLDDLSNDRDLSRRSQSEIKLSAYPVISTGLGREGDYVNTKHQQLWEDLRRIIFPGLEEQDRRYLNKVRDIDHLLGHILNGRDMFVTEDQGILKKSLALKPLGIHAMDMINAGEYIEASQWKAPQIRKHPNRPDYHNQELSGKVSFDYSNNDHVYTIGSGSLLFETRWSTCSNESMYVYSDPASIQELSVAYGVTEPAMLDDISSYDFTSRARQASLHDLIILKNQLGYYALIKIIKIIHRSKQTSSSDLLEFRYVINTELNASLNFLRF